MTVTQSIAVGVLLRALGFETTVGRNEPPPTEAEIRDAAELLADAASKRMQMSYLPQGARGKIRLRVRR